MLKKNKNILFLSLKNLINILVTISKLATSTLISDKLNVNNKALKGSFRNVDWNGFNIGIISSLATDCNKRGAPIRLKKENFF